MLQCMSFSYHGNFRRAKNATFFANFFFHGQKGAKPKTEKGNAREKKIGEKFSADNGGN